MKKLIVTIVGVLLLAPVCLAGGAPSAKPVTSAAAVRHLTQNQARQELPVSLRGVITYVNPRAGELFVQDNSAGVFVFIRESTFDAPLRSGQLVSVSGVSAPGDFSSSVTKARISVLGESIMPEPAHTAPDRIPGGEMDSQWGRMVGVVRQGRVENGALNLNAVTANGPFLAILKEFPTDWSTTLVDSKISFTGVLAALFNEQRQATGIRIFVPSPAFIHVDEPPSASPFRLPETAIRELGAFGAKHGGHRVRIRAGITAAASSRLIYVSDGKNSLTADLATTCRAEVGTVVDLVGFAGISEGRPALQDAVCRAVDAPFPVQPLEMPVQEILPATSTQEGSGLAIAKGMRNDLRLITVEGTVSPVTDSAAARALTLVSGSRNFSVLVPESVSWRPESIEPGTRLRVTGVCLIDFDEYHHARSFRLLVRRVSDVLVVSRSAAYQLRHAAWIVVPVLLGILAAISWIWVLRRHVAVKTRALFAANERLSQLAVMDPLTGSANRRCFDRRLREELAYARDAGRALSLLMIDLDFFKQVNDAYGHQQGDRNLIQVVGALGRILIERPDALLARYGGEEFTVILPATKHDDAVLVAEQMRESVHDMAIPHERSPFDQRQTVSLGVATLEVGAQNIDADMLVEMADRALYQAKRLGRNRVLSFNSQTLFATALSTPASLTNA